MKSISNYIAITFEIIRLQKITNRIETNLNIELAILRKPKQSKRIKKFQLYKPPTQIIEN